MLLNIRKLVSLLAACCCATPAFAATITVDSLADGDGVNGNCTLREAIESANGDSAEDNCTQGVGDDEIVFSVSGSIMLTADLPNITDNLTITGKGVDQTVIDGNDLYILLRFTTSSQQHTVRQLTLQNGLTPYDGGAIYLTLGSTLNVDHAVIKGSTSTTSGGGIYTYNNTPGSASSTLIVKSTTIFNNTAQGAGGGGGIFGGHGAQIKIYDSTIVNNKTTNATAGAGGIKGQAGGPHQLASSLLIERSTVAHNLVMGTGSGTGIRVSGDSNVQFSAEIRHSTIVGNIVDKHSSGGRGGVSLTNSDLMLANSIVAKHTYNNGGNSNDIYSVGGNSITSEGYNLIGDNDTVTAEFPVGSPNGNMDIVGTSGALIDPDLGPLQDNGGPTLTRAPASNASPVVDQGLCTGQTSDQRGFHSETALSRAVDDSTVTNASGGDGCDIGAVELGAVAELLDDSACFVIPVQNGGMSTFCL